MEVEETALPVIESSDENNAKKGKLLNLLFPSEAVPAEGKDVKKDKNKPLTKVVIRRLPPRLTKEAFTEEFSPLPPYDYFYFVRGDLSLGNHSFSRAYINFLNQEDIYAFKEKYDDYGVQDEKGKVYHAVVEFAPFQRVPRRNILKKKLSKAGTLESETKYLEFLKKLEEYKNNATNTSEYFHETESTSVKAKVTTTPLLEFLKAKKQKKNDLKNDLRNRKRELEKERKKKEEEKRKLERERKKEEKKRYDDRSKIVDDKTRKSDERPKDSRKNEVRVRPKEEKKDGKNWKDSESCSEDKTDILIATDPAILQVVMRQPEKGSLTNTKNMPIGNDESVVIKNGDSDSNLVKIERKYADFRSRIMEEKQKKTFHKRDMEDSKTYKFNSRSRKGVPDEKGDNSSIGNWSEIRDSGKKSESDLDTGKKQDSKSDLKETKSKFRYSEQRNREREFRSQKGSDWKKDGLGSNLKNKGENGKESDVAKGGDKRKERAKEENDNSGDSQDAVPVKNRRRSLELEKTSVEEVRKRSSSFHDLSTRKINDFRAEKKKIKSESEKKGHLGGGSKEKNSSEKTEDDGKKDARAERRIRNKDRPSMEIYRPGMGKFSKQRLEQKKEEVNPGGVQNSIKNSRIVSRTSTKKPSVEGRPVTKTEKGEEKTVAKTGSDIRTMTFARSGSREN